MAVDFLEGVVGVAAGEVGIRMRDSENIEIYNDDECYSDKEEIYEAMTAVICRLAEVENDDEESLNLCYFAMGVVFHV